MDKMDQYELTPRRYHCLSETLTPDERWMREALTEAETAIQFGEVPVGAVIVHQNKIIARAHNEMESLKDASAHAEMLALRRASATLGRWRLDDVDLYVTLEPCPMCAMAMVLFRIRRLVFGASEPKTGSAGSFLNLVEDSRLNHQIIVTGGICASEASEMMVRFFRARRAGVLPQKDVLG